MLSASFSRRLFATLCVGILFAGATARAEGDAARWLVIVVPGQQEELPLAEDLAEVLVAAVAQAGSAPVGPESLLRDHPQLSSLRRCVLDLGCLSRAAATLGVSRALLGLLSKEGDTLALTLELMDTEGRRSLARASRRCPAEQAGATLLALAEQVLEPARTAAASAKVLTLKVEGGEAERILLDGRPVGRGSLWTGEGLAPGEHELVLELAGGQQLRRRVLFEGQHLDLVWRVGAAASPRERLLQRSEQALFEGRASAALSAAEEGIAAGGEDLPELHIAAARAALALLDQGSASPAQVDRGLEASRRAIDLKGGLSASRVVAEFERRLGRVRLEPGAGWRQPGDLQLRRIEGPGGGPATLAAAQRERLEALPLRLPLEIWLPRPGHYEINGRELRLAQEPEGRSLVLTLGPAADPPRRLPVMGLSLLLAAASGVADPYLGLGLDALGPCWGASCLGARLDVVGRPRSPAEVEAAHRLWLRLGPRYTRFLQPPTWRVDASAELLYEPGPARAGAGISAALGWAPLGWGPRVGLRPSWNVFGFRPAESVLGVQLELSYEL